MQANSTPYRRGRVLAVPRDSVAAFYQKPQFLCDKQSVSKILKIIKEEGRFVDREWAESTETVKQIVAYGVLRNGKRVLRLRRAKKSERAALRLRYTILVGGHVDDLEFESSTPFEDCLLREIEEELGITLPLSPELLGIAVDPTTKVGRLHLGLIFDVPVSVDTIKVRSNYDNTEFVNADQVNVHHFVDVKTLIRSARQFDPWSTLLLTNQVADSLLGDARPFRTQLELPFVWTSQ